MVSVLLIVGIVIATVLTIIVSIGIGIWLSNLDNTQQQSTSSTSKEVDIIDYPTTYYPYPYYSYGYYNIIRPRVYRPRRWGIRRPWHRRR